MRNLLTDCISNINNIQADNSKNIDVVMSMHNSIKYSDNYTKEILCNITEMSHLIK